MHAGVERNACLIQFWNNNWSKLPVSRSQLHRHNKYLLLCSHYVPPGTLQLLPHWPAVHPVPNSIAVLPLPVSVLPSGQLPHQFLMHSLRSWNSQLSHLQHSHRHSLMFDLPIRLSQRRGIVHRYFGLRLYRPHHSGLSQLLAFLFGTCQ